MHALVGVSHCYGEQRGHDHANGSKEILLSPFSSIENGDCSIPVVSIKIGNW